MKYRALLSATALISASFSPISMITTQAFATPAPAADPSPPDEQAICDANYVNNQEDPTAWRSSVTGASSQATNPAPVDGTAENVNYRPDTTSTFSYAGFTNTTNPLYRIGGSPNMWGQMSFNDKVWDNTLYDVQMDFNHSVTYNWTCHVEEYVNHPVWIPPVPGNNGGGGGNGGQCTGDGGNNVQTGGNGNGNNGCGNGNGGSTGTNGGGGGGGNGHGNNNGNNQQNGGNGDGNNGCGNGNGGPNGSNDNCDGGGVIDPGTPGYWQDHYTWDFVADYPETQTNNGIDDGYDITQTGLQLAGHVDGVIYDVFGTYTPYGYILLSCISPGKKGGAWTAKSYYTGGQCSTTTFNAAPTILGHQFDSPPTASVPGQ